MTRRSASVRPDGEVASALDRLCDELAVVRQVLDDIHAELQWANRNGDDYCSSHAAGFRRVTSMPLDPTAREWAERLNRVTPADLADDDRPSGSNQQSQLF